MSAGLFTALEWVRDPATVQGLSPTARHLLAWLVIHTGRQGTSYPSVETLADLMGITPSNVRRARAELVDADLIAVSFGGGRGRSNTYLLRHGSNPEVLSTTRAPARGFTEAPVTVNRAETRAETRAVPRDQGGRDEGDVHTERDAIRAVPPWQSAGISRTEWLEGLRPYAAYL